MADIEAVTSIRDQLLKDRQALLDLSTRNRLLNVPLRTRNIRVIEIVDEKLIEVFRLLSEGKGFTFLPGRQLNTEEREELDPEDRETGGIPQPDENEEVDERGVAKRHTDLHLQTRLTSEGLQKRLFDIWYDARMLEEEQGVNILYLAMGLLRWFENDSSDLPRHAPLVLLPVQLERTSAGEKFRLKWRMEPPSPNLTLQAKMKAEFGLIIEDFADEDAVDLSAYFAKVAETISKQPRWEVLPNAMVLGFFSFSKFLMYRDLDPDNWLSDVAIDKHPLITAILRDGFPESEPLIKDDQTKIDSILPTHDFRHVVDADSSQAIAIEEAASGRTMVVKGPPGTGKSQTITNIIAAAAAKGRKILFVAEKMAALDVVHRRLKQAGLGALTLELHSNKANKRAVLEELRRTRDLIIKPLHNDTTVVKKLEQTRDRLNEHAERIHLPLTPSGLTPYQIIGRLVRIQHLPPLEVCTLEAPENWTAEDVEIRRRLLIEIAERTVHLGPLPIHPWRGVRCDSLDPSEVQALGQQIDALIQQLTTIIDAVESAQSQLGAFVNTTLADFHLTTRILEAATTIPIADSREALCHTAWANDIAALVQLTRAGPIHVAAKAAVNKLFIESAWETDFAQTRTAIATKGKSIFRLLNSEYRQQIALLKSYLKNPLPKTAIERIALVDQMITAQAARTNYEYARSAGPAFGRLWRDETSDWTALQKMVDWRMAYDDIPITAFARFAAASCPETLARSYQTLSETLPILLQKIQDVVAQLHLDITHALCVTNIETISPLTLLDRLQAWRANLENLTRYITFAIKVREAATLGLGTLVEALYAGKLLAADLELAFERAYIEAIRFELFKAQPALKAFDGESQNRLVAEFRKLDKLRIELTKESIAYKHAEERPKGAAGIGPLGVLNGELAKKSRHLPIRQLLEKAGPAIQQLKPVFMMSPLSVAQFLKPGEVSFDLLVMDEASQIEPVDALGAVARARQIIVVGDERQLPPTRFFAKLTSDVDEREEDAPTFEVRDAESILDLCLAKGMPHRMLNWHYRSKHQSLIAVSNREFYESRLFIIPSPYDATAGMGLKYHYLPHAHYDRGGSRTNPIEARTVAQAAIQHARQTPEHSLGIATFSVAQRQAILKELELLRRAHPEVEEFFSKASDEPFFVKNLENIQGDERDIIFISVGYGKTEQGYLAHNFGPLSSEGGERRLNVLISRAKLRCEIFTNIRGDDIDLERSRTRGVAALKLFLTFAETGKFGLGEPSGRDHDSIFEEQVAAKLIALGYDVKTQIGAAGFFIDLAVSDPEKPGRFILGIECDGAQYHSSRSARDRDRLRQQVLEAHDWIIHRIWSTDWYMRPQEELHKLEEAIKAARDEWRDRDERCERARHAVPLSFEAESIDEDQYLVTAIVDASTPPLSSRQTPIYQEASFLVNTSFEPHDAPLADMAAYVAQIVKIEGPIHLDEIATRIRMLWGLHRAGSRIRAAVAKAAKVAAAHGLIEGGPFYLTPGQPIVVRDRSGVISPTLRKPEYLPPAEIEVCLLKIVEDNFGASRADLILAASRIFGYSATSAQLKSVLDSNIERLLTTGQLIAKADLLVRP